MIWRCLLSKIVELDAGPVSEVDCSRRNCRPGVACSRRNCRRRRHSRRSQIFPAPHYPFSSTSPLPHNYEDSFLSPTAPRSTPRLLLHLSVLNPYRYYITRLHCLSGAPTSSQHTSRIRGEFQCRSGERWSNPRCCCRSSWVFHHSRKVETTSYVQ